MKSALVIIFAFVIGLLPSQVLAADPVEHDAQCVAIYITQSGKDPVGVPNGGTYPITLKSGEKFHVEIKMKNLGTKPWLKSQNYKLGKSSRAAGDRNAPDLAVAADADELQWGLNRIEIPNNNPVSSGSEIIFAFDPVNLHEINNQAPFWWGMMRERTETNTEEGGNQVVDPGVRFGQVCKIYLNVEGSKDKPAVQTPAKTPESPRAPDIKTSTVCIDTQKGTQNVSASWTGYSASSVKVFLRGGTNLVDSGACLGSGTQSYTFPKTVPADTVYKVSVVPFRDSACVSLDLSAPTGGYVADVTNGGFVSPKNYTDPSIFHLKNMFVEIGNVRSKFNFESCAPTSYILPIPTGKTALHSFDVPISILLTRFAAGTNGTVQRNDINSKYPVIIRYRPILQGDDGNIQRAPVSSSRPNGSEPGTTREEVGEP